jgi:uncharacterized protein
MTMASRFRDLFPSSTKPLIAMAHIPAFPGTPLYNEVDGVRGLIEHVRRDVRILADAGFDAILFCNENDRPYQLHAGPESAAVMTRVITECRPDSVAFGVDFLWDPRIALAAAVAAEANFIRAVATGAWESDMGLWATNCAEIMRERRRLHADGLAVFMNITPEFASAIGRREPAAAARSAAVSSLADAILVSGPMAGASPDLGTVRAVKQATPPEVPVLLNTGARGDSIAQFLAVTDGCIVGSDLKQDGVTWNPVDPVRANQFVKIARNG